MGRAFDVSDNIGFDGSTFFCKRCGKAGYERATQVRGHLAMCPGTLMRKGGAPTTSRNQLQPLASGYDGGLAGGQPVEAAVVAGPVSNQLDSRYEELAGRVATMENHYTHVMESINPPQHQSAQQDFFTQYKGLIIVGAIILFAIIMSNQSGQCQAEEILETLKTLTKSIEKLESLDVSKLKDDLEKVAKEQKKSSPNAVANEFSELGKLAREIANRFGGSPTPY